jgi:hypothetical protein
MGLAHEHTAEAQRIAEPIDPVVLFSRGDISRKQAMRALGGISYGELIDMIAVRGLSLPELPPEDVDRMANDVVDLLAMAGR